jgi:hypothetical protein
MATKTLPILRDTVASPQVIDSYLSTQQETRERSYEEGELVLYRNMILQEAGKLTEALEHLDAEDK